MAQIKESAAKHVLPPLQYPCDAQTLEIHHDKHHLAYVNGLNVAETAVEKARTDNDFQMIRRWSRQVAFHGADQALHALY